MNKEGIPWILEREARARRPKEDLAGFQKGHLQNQEEKVWSTNQEEQMVPTMNMKTDNQIQEGKVQPRKPKEQFAGNQKSDIQIPEERVQFRRLMELPVGVPIGNLRQVVKSPRKEARLAHQPPVERPGGVPWQGKLLHQNSAPILLGRGEELLLKRRSAQQ